MRANGVKAVLFDKDGTLFDFQKSWGAFGARVIADLAGGDAALERSLAEAADFDMERQLYGPNSPIVAGAEIKMVQAWAALHPTMNEADILGWLAPRAKEMTQRGLEPATADLPALLGRLKAAGLRLGVATHDYEAAARAHLDRAGALDAFDFIAGVDSGYAQKPAPEMLAAFAAQGGVEASAVVMVGDSVVDLEMGRNAGAAASVAVLTGPAPEARLRPSADIVIPSIAALPAVLGLEQ